MALRKQHSAALPDAEEKLSEDDDARGLASPSSSSPPSLPSTPPSLSHAASLGVDDADAPPATPPSDNRIRAAAEDDPSAVVRREIGAFLDAFESATVSEFAWISTSLTSVASTVSIGSSAASTPELAAALVAAAASPRSTSKDTSMLPWHHQRENSSKRERLSVESMELERVGDVYLFLLELQQKLQCRDAFNGEEERTKWWWLVHQLKQQRQRYPEKWGGMTDMHLVQIEVAIANLPLAGDGTATTSGADRASASSSAAYELRISVNDIPMLESKARNQRRASAECEDDTSWTSFSRIVREASGRTMRAFMGPPDRDSELFSTGNSGGDTRSRSGSGVSGRDSIPTLQRSSGSLSHSVPNLVRSVVSYLGLSMEETFMCQICFENVSVAKAFRLSKCGHLFCESCLQNYLQFKVGEGQVYPTCFHEKEGEPACAEEIVPDDIHAVVSVSTWEKYLKFKFNKEHENARQCPFCDHSQVYLGSEHPECVCESCGEEFCFVHSIAHRGRSCAEYEKKIVAIEKLNHAMINEISKPCPGCNNFVEKIGASSIYISACKAKTAKCD